MRPTIGRSAGRTAWATTLLLGGAACSALPPQEYPPHSDLRLQAIHPIAPGEQRWVRVPATDRHLRVFSLLAAPSAVAERYDENGRWLRTPPGPISFRVTAHLRDFGTDGTGPAGYRGRQELFPDAEHIHALTP